MSRTPDVADLVEGVLAGDRTRLARAITLVESRRPDHEQLAQQILTQLLPHAGNSHRIGITGVPGVGKSTFIDAFGSMLTGDGHRVAVLAVDPTSTRTGGSILGDKTRMARLATDSSAYIRPSPSSGTLGGVTRATRETMVVVEAAGYDVVLVETVGVGQSETSVAEMVDFFCVLMLAGAGDELQGIKKGVLELADMIAINKAEAPNEQRARQAARDYQNALHLMTPASLHWTPPVLTCAGLTGVGLETIWDQITMHRRLLTEAGEWDETRHGQQVRWMWRMVDDRLGTAFRRHPEVAASIESLESQVRSGQLPATSAAWQLLEAFGLGTGQPD